MKLHDALRDASDNVAPDVEHLITRARSGGTRRRRSRHAVHGAAVVASVALIAAIGIGDLRDGDTTDRAAGDAATSESPSTSTGPANERRQMASPEVIVDRLTEMLDGTVTEVSTRASGAGERPSIHISLLLNGAAVTALVNDASPQDPATVPAPGPQPSGCPALSPGGPTLVDLQNMTKGTLPERRAEQLRIQGPAYPECIRWMQAKSAYDCAQVADCWSQRQWGDNPCRTEPSVRSHCTRLPDGGWAWQGSQPIYSEDGPDHPTDLMESFGRAYPADDWEIQLSAYNSAGEKQSPALLEQTVLSPEELATLAASDIWFR